MKKIKTLLPLLVTMLSFEAAADEPVTAAELDVATEALNTALDESLSNVEDQTAENLEGVKALSSELSYNLSQADYDLVTEKLNTFMALRILDFSSEQEVPEIDVLIENDDYKAWAAENSVDPVNFLKKLLRLEFLYGVYMSTVALNASAEEIQASAEGTSQELEFQVLIADATNSAVAKKIDDIQDDIKASINVVESVIQESSSGETINTADLLETSKMIEQTAELSIEQAVDITDQQVISNEGFEDITAALASSVEALKNVFTATEFDLMRQNAVSYGVLRTANGLQ